jgi:peptidoglycan hydrolase-like protein with peptidoglycan-binding domain
MGILKKGSKGPSVTDVQTELKKRVAPKLPVTGYYGGQTEQAVRDFQKSVGFKGKQIDGQVGDQTMLALFPVYHLKIDGFLLPKLRMPEFRLPDFLPPPPKYTLRMRPDEPPSTPPATPTPAPATPTPPSGEDKPSWLQGNVQGGAQYSLRDGFGAQFSAALTLRLPDYKIGSLTTHGEIQGTVQIGLPNPPSDIYTGQYSLNVQPVTDALMIHDKVRKAQNLPERYQLHFLNGFANIFYQGPIAGKSQPGVDDLASHPRVGGNLGANFVQLDLGSTASIVLAGQLALYRDLQNNHSYADPQLMLYAQIPLGSWFKYK